MAKNVDCTFSMCRFTSGICGDQVKHSWFRSRWIRSLIGALAAAAALAVGIVAAQDGASLTEDQLRNLEYPNDFTTGGTAPLTDGAYTEPIQPGAATQTEVRFDRAAFGSIDGQPAAAVILGTDPEGTGFFVNLHLVDADLVPLVTTLLGDRVRIQALQIISDRIVVDFLGFAPTDPLCCRTQNVSQAYALQAGALRLVSAVSLPALIDVPEGLSLIGWYGEPTAASAVLASAPLLQRLWWFDPATDRWILDDWNLPLALRPAIAIARGAGFFVVAQDATAIPVPLTVPPPPCPLNPGPVNSVAPSMVIQSPGNGATLSSPLIVTGRARVFEATVSLRLLDADGAVLTETFTMAAEAGPALAPFTGAVPFAVAAATPACLQVFETSARDGSQRNVVQIGLTLLPPAISP